MYYGRVKKKILERPFRYEMAMRRCLRQPPNKSSSSACPEFPRRRPFSMVVPTFSGVFCCDSPPPSLARNKGKEFTLPQQLVFFQCPTVLVTLA